MVKDRRDGHGSGQRASMANMLRTCASTRTTRSLWTQVAPISEPRWPLQQMQGNIEPVLCFGLGLLKLPTDFAGWAISFRGEELRREKGEAGPHGGRGQGIHLHAATTAAKFRMDGPKDNMAIRKHGDEDLAMEVAHRKMVPNSDITLWCVGLHEPHREWACRFCMNDDGTISPCDKGNPCKDVVIGVHLGEGWKRTGLVLVHREDTKRRLVFLQGSENCPGASELRLSGPQGCRHASLTSMRPLRGWMPPRSTGSSSPRRTCPG
ncbi:unnamed protein product [Symbiodinium sp. CCMP2592]|nr:unnamed protein product [Symbiodinium sp. CCMP2592]